MTTSASDIAVPIRWPAEAIWEAVAPALPGFAVEVLPSIDSTNTELMRRLRGHGGLPAQPEPLLLVAEQQTAGRGRLGRKWQSKRGDSLTFSLSLPMQPVDWSGLSLAVGISLAETLDPAGKSESRIRLKWPNDLWLSVAKSESSAEGYRKLGGILVETTGTTDSSGVRHVVIGIGINIVPMQGMLPADPGAALPAVMPGALQDFLPNATAADTLLKIVPPLVQALQAFEKFGFAPFQARFAARDVLAGEDVVLSDGATGTAHGVSESGALLVHTAAGMKEITSSEVSVRPASLAGHAIKAAS